MKEYYEYLDTVYDYVKQRTDGLDSVYEDYILALVGELGLEFMKKHNLIESCGVINGRQLWVLCDKKKGGQNE